VDFVQGLIVRSFCGVAPVDMLAVEVASIQIELWERRDEALCSFENYSFQRFMLFRA